MIDIEEWASQFPTVEGVDFDTMFDDSSQDPKADMMLEFMNKWNEE